MIRQAVFAGALSLSSLCTPFAAYADAAGEAMVGDIINSISALPNWNAISTVIRSDGDRVIVEGLSISHTTNGMTVSVEALDLTDFSGRGSGYFASAVSVRGMTVRYDLVSMTGGNAARQSDVSMANTITVDRMDISDLYLPGQMPPGRAGADEGILAPLVSIYGYLADVELASAVAPVIVNDQVISGVDGDAEQTSRATYRDSRISNWRDGVVERMDIGQTDLTISGGPSGEVVISAQSALAEHFDLGHYIHVLDPNECRGGSGDGVWKTALRRFEYSGLRMNAATAETSIERISVADFEIRQTEKPFLNGLDDLLAIAVSGREPSESEALAIVSDFLPNMLGAFRLGRMRMEGMMVRPVVSSDPGSFSIDTLTVAGLSNAGIDRFAVDGIAVTGPNSFSIKLETVGADGLTFPDWGIIEAFVEAGAAGEEIGKNADLMVRVLDLYPSIDTFSLRGLSGNSPGKETIRVDEIVLEIRKRVAGFMASGRGAVRGVSIPASYLDDTGNPNGLRLLGYDRFAMDYVFESDWDEVTTVLDAGIDLSIENAGELELRYGVSGITDDEVRRMIRKVVEMEASGQSKDPEQIMDLLRDVGTTGVSVSFADRSFIQRALRIAAEQQGSDTATYARQLKAAIPFFLSAVPPGRFRDQLNQAAQAALDGGRKTTVSLSPGQPVLFPQIVEAAMQDPWSLIDLLGAGASTEPVN